jgi:hypothetical protein
LEEQAERWHKDFGMPKERFWDRWTDPRGTGKWVVVLHAKGKAYWKVKKGF